MDPKKTNDKNTNPDDCLGILPSLYIQKNVWNKCNHFFST